MLCSARNLASQTLPIPGFLHHTHHLPPSTRVKSPPYPVECVGLAPPAAAAAAGVPCEGGGRRAAGLRCVTVLWCLHGCGQPLSLAVVCVCVWWCGRHGGTSARVGVPLHQAQDAEAQEVGGRAAEVQPRQQQGEAACACGVCVGGGCRHDGTAADICVCARVRVAWHDPVLHALPHLYLRLPMHPHPHPHPHPHLHPHPAPRTPGVVRVLTRACVHGHLA